MQKVNILILGHNKLSMKNFVESFGSEWKLDVEEIRILKILSPFNARDFMVVKNTKITNGK